MNRELICIICPNSCVLTAEISEGQVAVSGHSCPKGEEYALSECLHPMRTLTAAVRVSNRMDTMVSVKTEVPIPKEKMMALMEILHSLSLPAPIAPGDIILPDAFGTRIIATKEIP